MRSVLLGVLFVCALSLSGYTRAFDLGIEARAEVGIDPATMEFIRTLPEAYRPQIKAIVDDTLDRVDESVDRYLTTIDKLLTGKIIELQCATVGVSKDVAEQLVRVLPWMASPRPIADLRAHVKKEREQIALNQAPLDIMDRYSDLMLAAAVVSCQSAYVPEAQKQAKAIIEDLRRHWLVWNRVVASGCSTFEKCVPDFHAYVVAMVVKGDHRDDEAAGASEALKRLEKRPQGPGFLQQLDLEKFEAYLQSITKTEDRWRAEHAARMARAAEVYATGVAKLAAANKALSAASTALKQRASVLLAQRIFHHMRVGSHFGGGIPFPVRLYRPAQACSMAAAEYAGAFDKADGLIAASTTPFATALDLVPELKDDVAAQQEAARAITTKIKKARTTCV